MTEQVLQAIINGLLIGGVYAVVSIGLALVFGVMDIVNFAQAEFLMVGMYLSYLLLSYFGIDPIVGAPLVLVGTACLGALVQRLLIQPVLKAPMVSQIFLTVGLSVVLVSSAQLLFGANFLSAKTSYQTEAVRLGGIALSVPYLFAFAASALVTLLLWLVLERTDLGRAMRATAQNRTAAILMGIDPNRMFVLAFAIGTGLAGFAGAVILPYAYVYPTIGHQYALIMFTVVVLGGLGSVPGAIVGGLAIGIIHSTSAVFLPIQLQNLVVFIIFITTLMLRPSGLFGRPLA